MLLKGKVVLVTGSISEGIGEAIAMECLAEGAKVVFHGLPEEEEHAKELMLQLQIKHHVTCVIADLKDTDNYEKLIQATVDRFGRIDCLVNNAATMQRADLNQITPALFDEVMAVNAKAPLFLAQAAIKQFIKQQSGGRIFNIGSINAYCGQKDLLAYAMTKGALMTMTRTLGDTSSLGKQGIFINQFNLGWVSSKNEIALKRREGWPANWHNNIPVYMAPSGRILTPQEIAKNVAFMMSGQGGPVNGSVIDLEQFPMTVRLNGNQNAFFQEIAPEVKAVGTNKKSIAAPPIVSKL